MQVGIVCVQIVVLYGSASRKINEIRNTGVDLELIVVATQSRADDGAKSEVIESPLIVNKSHYDVRILEVGNRLGPVGDGWLDQQAGEQRHQDGRAVPESILQPALSKKEHQQRRGDKCDIGGTRLCQY